MKTRVALTGACSLVGAEVLKELLSRPETGEIRLLMAAEGGEWERLAAYLGPLPPAVSILACDLRLPRFGLSVDLWEDLANGIDLVFHCAQREAQDQNLELARQANLYPVETWIQLLNRRPELRLHHLSTAFIGGRRRGLLTEFDLNFNQSFHNAWEQSKFEAEVRLRESAVSDRVAIYRPSHTLGRAASGEAIHLGGDYPLLATLAAARILPGDVRARLDVVPADYVAAAMVALAFSGAEGTFHLAGGWEASLPVRRAADLAALRPRKVFILPRAAAWPMRFAGLPVCGGLISRRLAFRTARDLLHQGPVFDTYRADLALASTGIRPPAAESWFPAAVRGAEARSWEAPPAGPWESAVKEANLPSATAETGAIHSGPAFTKKLFVRVGEADVAYRDIGEGEPVVFFHGLAGTHAWDGVVQRIATTRRAVIVEPLGLGDSEAPPHADFSLAGQAVLARGLLSALEIPAAHIVGHGMGGIVAQIFAVRWPQFVKSLVLSDCDVQGSWPPRGLKHLAALPGLLLLPPVARALFGRMVYDKRLLTKERLARSVHTLCGNRKRRALLKRFLRSLDRAALDNLNQRLAQLEVETMIVWGADNAVVSPSYGKVLFDTIPQARRFELIPFAGACSPEERPDLFAPLLGDFLDQVDLRAKAQAEKVSSACRGSGRSVTRAAESGL
jgi:pimeloyl-ACP methyl ester carboxylesterase/nucleoside-diphosphate-sugar epimerase